MERPHTTHMKGTPDHHPRGELDELEYIFPQIQKEVHVSCMGTTNQIQ